MSCEHDRVGIPMDDQWLLPLRARELLESVISRCTLLLILRRHVSVATWLAGRWGLIFGIWACFRGRRGIGSYQVCLGCNGHITLLLLYI